jgi:hypothetical protein
MLPNNFLKNVEWIASELKTHLLDDEMDVGLKPDGGLLGAINEVEEYLQSTTIEYGPDGYDESEPGHPDNPRTF